MRGIIAGLDMWAEPKSLIPMNDKPFHRIVLTGAAGKLGSVLRAPLRALKAQK